MFERSEFAIFSNPMIRNLWGILNLIQGNSLYVKKLAEKASFIFLPSAKEPLGGVTVRGCKGEPD